MTDDSDKREAQDALRAKESAPHGKDSRRQRLKLALRDNLRRRKSQARQRSKMTDAPSNDRKGALDDDTGSKGGGWRRSARRNLGRV